MIWENNIDKIVMLTNLLEGEKKKCEQYWPNPNEKMTGGQYGLTLKDERIFSYYTLRELQIVDNKSKEKRDILQYHFTTWPDHGTPDPLLLILFQKRVTSTAPKYDGPILVHCSAGIGRTGTFIALDALASHGANTGVVDIENYVRIMRKDRMNMIQTSMLREMNIVSEDEMSLTALKEENKIKNRSVNILPLDKHRPFLTSYCSGRNDYINAVIIPSHISKEAFMVTQVPLPGTIVDFWRLITDNDSRCIIYFASSSDEEVNLINLKQ
ncbi:hypothetical protein FSP39_019323 [Pinctada imbricata]|uniref:Uncharacterized protein n=1 Tax=Pinctada imbricata TaxID=66713 RepID=A0AA88Y2A9_PINIB|nr:hypothetical protein FSP39_019323 [Pinctada imbricata]